MTSPALGKADRIRQSTLFRKLSPRRFTSEYDMEELDPRPLRESTNDIIFDHDATRTNRTPPSSGVLSAVSSSSSPESRYSTQRSIADRTARSMFSGPPPPIASTIFANNASERGRRRSSSHQDSQLSGAVQSSNHSDPPSHSTPGPDSVWWWLRRREKVLEDGVQELLDLQAAGLVAGSEGIRSPTESELEAISDTGSSTPTETFYSTATSKSRMLNSFHVPTRSTTDGNIIPVRQPKKRRAPRLRSARNGIGQLITALYGLKQEEDDYLSQALSKRKTALKQLAVLDSRRTGISDELRTFEQDQHEPLGQELRDLSTAHDTLSEEIRLMEEKLVGMRNRRRWLRDKMDDVRSKRDAGLSGYRGALRDVESDMHVLLSRPPIQPLQSDLLEGGGGTMEHTASGVVFMRMNPQRRTAEMARSWWESEISVLEHRRSLIVAEQQALKEGSTVWTDVLSLVTEFEETLRRVMQTSMGPDLPEGSSKGKEILRTREDLMREQLSRMNVVVSTLEEKMDLAESNRWNLLICAIGAELEAFREAQEMLRASFELQGLHDENSSAHATQSDAPDKQKRVEHQDESDNEVPDDLLVSPYEHGRPASSAAVEQGTSVEPSSADETPIGEALADEEENGVK